MALFNMSLNRAVASAVCASLFFGFIYTQIELIPERSGLYEVNKKYLKYAKFFINRYGRKSSYYANLEFELNEEMNNNCTMEAVFFEKLGNEYKRSFIEIKQKLCYLINKDDFIGPSLRATGRATCPIAKGDYHWLNLTLKSVTFPYKWPFEYARADATLYQSETKEKIASGYLYLRMKQQKKKKQ